MGAHLWRWFWELSGQRSGNGYGPNALAFVEIEAWMRLTGARLAAWERRAILAMDRTYRETCAVMSDPERSKGENLTPDLLAEIARG